MSARDLITVERAMEATLLDFDKRSTAIARRTRWHGATQADLQPGQVPIGGGEPPTAVLASLSLDPGDWLLMGFTRIALEGPPAQWTNTLSIGTLLESVAAGVGNYLEGPPGQTVHAVVSYDVQTTASLISTLTTTMSGTAYQSYLLAYPI